MANNIDINITNNGSGCKIDLYNIDLEKNTTLTLTNESVYTKNIKQNEELKAYELDGKAIIEAVTLKNTLPLKIDIDNPSFVPEEKNRIAIYSNGEAVAQVVIIKSVDENSNEVESSIHLQENNIEVFIEKQSNKATIILEFAPYIEFDSENMIFLRSFGEVDYWYDGVKYQLYTVNKFNVKREYIKIPSSYIAGAAYMHNFPAMISETVFYSNYKRGFFKINGTEVTKIKDDSSIFYLTHLYDDVWITVSKENYTYIYNIVEFTDIEAAVYEIKDTYELEIGKYTYDEYYIPYKMFDYNENMIINFHTYKYNSYIPANQQKLCARIDKSNKRFDFTNIDDMQIIEYEDDEYRVHFDWRNQKRYINNEEMSYGPSFPLKLMTLREEDVISLYDVSYTANLSSVLLIDLKNKSYEGYGSVPSFNQMWPNGSYAGFKSIEAQNQISGWDVIKDNDIFKRYIRRTTRDDYIIPDELYSDLESVLINPPHSIFLRKEVIQNKKLLTSLINYNMGNISQRNNEISYGISVTENTDVEIKTYNDLNYYFDKNFILTEEKEFNIFTSITDIQRIAANENFNLSIDETKTIFDKNNNTYDLKFSKWIEATESFEVNPLIEFIGDMDKAVVRDEISVSSSKSLFLTAGYREKKYIEFKTKSKEVSFSVYPSSYPYGTELYTYVNGLQKDGIYDSNSNNWSSYAYKLDENKISTIRFEINKIYENQESKYNGYFIDDITCNILSDVKETEIYFKSIDLGMYPSSRNLNIVFSDLEKSSNITQAIYYSLDSGDTWNTFRGQLPNQDNILLKAVFIKPSVDAEAYVRVSNVVVKQGNFEVITRSLTKRRIKDNIIKVTPSFRKVTKSAVKDMVTLREVVNHSNQTIFLDTMRSVTKVLGEVTLNSDCIRKVKKLILSECKTHRVVNKDVIGSLFSKRRVAINKSNNADTGRRVIKQKSTKVNADTERRVIKSLYNNSSIFRNVVVNENNTVLISRKVVIGNVKRLDASRIVNAIVSIDKELNTRRIVYKPSVLYVAQLNITYKLNNGLLIIENQELN